MKAKLQGIPKNSCRYEEYDPETLLPSNDSTIIRLIETGWSSATFKDKTVLDIGCNSGALSVFAAQNGAKLVKSVDVQHELVSFFGSVVRHHQLPVTVERASLDQLTVETHAADVVLCMEVLHWVVHQGGTITEAIAKLASLTNETLYVETPWDTNEPSIRNRPDYPVQEYDVGRIIIELSRHFESVEFKRFMSYFGKMKDSKRVLIEARGRRRGSLGARHIVDGTLSGISLSRGVNESYLVTSQSGPKVLKRVAASSILNRLDQGSANSLCRFLGANEAGRFIAPPLPLGDQFIRSETDGGTYMLFPFVGFLGDYFPKQATPREPRDPFASVLEMVAYFATAPEDVVASLREHSPPITDFDFRRLPEDYRDAFLRPDRAAFIATMRDVLSVKSSDAEDSVIHGDLQLGNFVLGPDGKDYIVDLDMLRSGPAYSDLFSASIYLGITTHRLKDSLSDLKNRMRRASTMTDVCFAANGCLNWLVARTKNQKALTRSQFDRFLKGFDNVISVSNDGI